MIDGTKVTATIASTRLDTLPTGTMYVELACDCAVDGQPARVPTKIFVTEKSAGRARGQLKAIGFDADKENIAALNTGDKSPLVGVELEIILKESKYGVQGELPQPGLDQSGMSRMAAMLKGGGAEASGIGAKDGDIPF